MCRRKLLVSSYSYEKSTGCSSEEDPRPTRIATARMTQRKEPAQGRLEENKKQPIFCGSHTPSDTQRQTVTRTTQQQQQVDAPIAKKTKGETRQTAHKNEPQKHHKRWRDKTYHYNRDAPNQDVTYERPPTTTVTGLQHKSSTKRRRSKKSRARATRAQKTQLITHCCCIPPTTMILYDRPRYCEVLPSPHPTSLVPPG